MFYDVYTINGDNLKKYAKKIKEIKFIDVEKEELKRVAMELLKCGAHKNLIAICTGFTIDDIEYFQEEIFINSKTFSYMEHYIRHCNKDEKNMIDVSSKEFFEKCKKEVIEKEDYINRKTMRRLGLWKTDAETVSRYLGVSKKRALELIEQVKDKKLEEEDRKRAEKIEMFLKDYKDEEDE